MYQSDMMPIHPEEVLYHTGQLRKFLKHHEHVVQHAMSAGISGTKQLAPYLLSLVSDPRALRSGWDYLRARGGEAPGPNGHHYDDLDDHEIWSLMGALGRAIRNGTYRHGPERQLQIPKGPDRGYRTLHLRNIEDRVVERSVVNIIQPILDPLFDDRSYGYRPKRDRLHALAAAERITTKECRFIWLVEDLKDTFDHVPHQRLLDLVRRYLHAPDLVALIERILANGTKRGVPQGSPSSPLLLNLYLHHLLDRVWRQQFPHLPLLRAADDLLVMCRSVEEARMARAALERILVPAGMTLKKSDKPTIHNIEDDGADWLGFEVRADWAGLQMTIGERAWGRLTEKLTLCHVKPHAPLRAIRVIEGWISQLGPCYPNVDREEVCKRVTTIARDFAFDEIPGSDDLKKMWRTSYDDRWCSLRGC